MLWHCDPYDAEEGTRDLVKSNGIRSGGRRELLGLERAVCVGL